MALFQKYKTDYKSLYEKQFLRAEELYEMLKEMKIEITKLKITEEEYKSKVIVLSFENEELEKRNKQSNSEIDNLKIKIENLEQLNKMYKDFHPKLKPHPKKVNKFVVNGVKKMISDGNNYRVTASKYNISTRTITRIMKNEYDHLL